MEKHKQRNTKRNSKGIKMSNTDAITKNITVKLDNWAALSMIKIKHNFDSLDQSISYVLKQMKNENYNTTRS